MAERSEPEGPHDEEDETPDPQEPESPRVPPTDPDDLERKWFFWADPAVAPPLVVTLSNGPVARGYAPAAVVAKFTDKVAALLREVGGGFEPMLGAAVPGRSISLVFVDPPPREAQGRLPVEVTLAQAKRISDLMELEGEDLFRRAVEIGAPMKRYVELAQTVQSEGVDVRWEARDEPPRVLDARRAQQQQATLASEEELQERPLVVNGVLYRVITESTREGFLGSVGIHLHSWSSPTPDGRRKPIVFYESREIEDTIRSEGLIGEPIEARMLVRQPVPGTSIEPNRFDLVLDSIAHGPDEDSRLGPRLTDPYADEE